MEPEQPGIPPRNPAIPTWRDVMQPPFGALYAIEIERRVHPNGPQLVIHFTREMPEVNQQGGSYVAYYDMDGIFWHWQNFRFHIESVRPEKPMAEDAELNFKMEVEVLQSDQDVQRHYSNRPATRSYRGEGFMSYHDALGIFHVWGGDRGMAMSSVRSMRAAGTSFNPLLPPQY